MCMYVSIYIYMYTEVPSNIKIMLAMTAYKMEWGIQVIS